MRFLIYSLTSFFCVSFFALGTPNNDPKGKEKESKEASQNTEKQYRVFSSIETRFVSVLPEPIATLSRSELDELIRDLEEYTSDFGSVESREEVTDESFNVFINRGSYEIGIYIQSLNLREENEEEDDSSSSSSEESASQPDPRNEDVDGEGEETDCCSYKVYDLPPRVITPNQRSREDSPPRGFDPTTFLGLYLGAGLQIAGQEPQRATHQNTRTRTRDSGRYELVRRTFGSSKGPY